MLRSELCRGGRKSEVLISKPVVMTLNSCSTTHDSRCSRAFNLWQRQVPVQYIPLIYGLSVCMNDHTQSDCQVPCCCICCNRT